MHKAVYVAVTILFLYLLIDLVNINRTLWKIIQTHRHEAAHNDQNVAAAQHETLFHINDIRKQRNKNNEGKLLLAVGVLNRLSLKARRDVVRMTWFKECGRNPGLVKCYFFTDPYDDLNTTETNKILEESRIHKDMQFMPIKGGHRFSERLLWMMQWYAENHNSFEYFLRVDDDYFICMPRLLYELPFRPDTGLYWGYTHCTDNVIRVDEGWMLLSRDIIDEVLAKVNTTLQCHPFGDQAMALWIKDSKLDIQWFPDNERIVHQATAYNEQQYMFPGFCRRYLAMHGSYQIQMLKYWILSSSDEDTTMRNNNKANTYYIPPIPEFASFCKKNRTFSVNAFWPHVRFIPKLCKDKPEWGVSKEKFVGREEYGQEMIY